MLSQELRPFDFGEIAGQEENKKILEAIVRNPDKAPKCIIFAGAFGSGKSTSARILARRLNNITDRDYNILESQFYYEYDSTVIGNVESIRQLRDQFTISYGDYWKIIVFDETHSVTPAAQNALLKVLEEVSGKIIFIMCTTEPNKLLPTIRSRSLELFFKKVPRESILENLAQVEVRKGITLPQDVKELIADRSEGHMRNAHMLIDKYLLLGEQDFRDSIQSATNWFCAYFIAIKRGQKDYVLKSINMLMDIPIENLHSDWNTIMVESMKYFNGYEVNHMSIVQLVTEYGREDFKSVIEIFFLPFAQMMFTDMPYFQASLLNIYAILNKKFYPPKEVEVVTQKVATVTSRDRAR